jgi:uncharacterized protein
VLTAAHCLLNGTELIRPGNVHFLAGMNKGRTESSSAAERFIVAKNFVPTLRDKWTLDRSPADWALIVLKDAVPARPVAVKALNTRRAEGRHARRDDIQDRLRRRTALFPDCAAKLPG